MDVETNHYFLQFDKIVIQGLGYTERKTVLMAFPEDAIHFMSVIVAGVISQTVPNSRCALMIITNVIVLIGAVLVGSTSKKAFVNDKNRT